MFFHLDDVSLDVIISPRRPCRGTNAKKGGNGKVSLIYSACFVQEKGDEVGSLGSPAGCPSYNLVHRILVPPPCSIP